MDTNDTASPFRRITPDEIPALLDELDESDLSVAAFARVRSLQPAPLYRALRKRKDNRRAAAAGFAPIRIVGPPPSSPAFTVELPGGAKLTVPPDFDSGALARLLEVLCPC